MRLKCQFARTSGLGVPVLGTKLARGIGSWLDALQKSYKIKCLRTFLQITSFDQGPIEGKFEPSVGACQSIACSDTWSLNLSLNLLVPPRKTRAASFLGGPPFAVSRTRLTHLQTASSLYIPLSPCY